MNNNNIATEILNQLGGRRFLIMTGTKNLMTDGENTLRMTLAKNKINAKILTVTLNSMDTYDLKFINSKGVVVKELNGYYNDMLQDGFTTVTGIYTKF